MKRVSLAALGLAGCTSSIKVTTPEGLEAEITSPIDAVEPPVIQVGDMLLQAGARQATDQALEHVSASTSWLGIGLVAAGLASLLLSGAMPFLPRSTSVILIAAGAAAFAFPILMDRYSTWVFIAVLGLVGLWVFGLFDNRQKLRTANEHPKGQ